MAKKVIASILSAMLIVSTVGCSTQQGNDVAPAKMEKVADLPGSWSKDYSREELLGLHNEILERVEGVANFYGLTEEYDVKEEIREENGNSINDNRIYLDIEKPEPNRLESMYYGFKQYGSDLARGELSMKLGFNLDKKAVIEAGLFDFKQTALSAFSEAFTNISDRDYTELNKQIFNLISGESTETIENNLDGIRETISVTDNFLLYKLETKIYNFK